MNISFQSLLAIADVFISSRPFKWLHFYCPLIFAIVYASFQVVYVVGAEGLDEVKMDAQKLYEIHLNKTKKMAKKVLNF